MKIGGPLIVLLGAIPAVHGMAELSEAILTARNLKELEKASSKNSTHTFGSAKRLRQLQDLGLEDSMPILADQFEGIPGFYHSVASGDPLPTSVIVWTRYTPATLDEDIELEFRMAKVDESLAVDSHLDPTANENLRRIRVTTNKDSDFIVKMDVTGLQDNSEYVFAFLDADGVASPVGQTKTAPSTTTSVDSLTYAVFSCSHFANGYFHAYDIASTIEDLDVWLHVGDYVYEYGTYGSYASDAEERRAMILPEWEQISLQDHRNRMATYHTDEGLQNLRRRAPLIAIWDDHETTNNPFGQGTRNTTGAQNHQEICPVNAASPDEEKSDAECDRDEGDVVARFNAAAQSYWEWMPIRHMPGSMGVINIGTLTQIISWGDLATFVAIDSRISHRSEDPTIHSSTWGSFFPFATANTDVSLYSNFSSDVGQELEAVAGQVHALLEDEKFSMIGEDQNILMDAFQQSVNAGQPWQIWAAATAMGRAVKGNYYALDELIDDPTTAAVVKNITDQIYASNATTFFRALSAQALTSTPWNRDDYSGFAFEQRQILASMKTVANNPIILAGDLHDGYGWTLFEDGAAEGTPCAVNLVCPGVTSPGWGPAVFPVFSVLSDVLGGDDAVYDLIERADEEANPGLLYFNNQFKGFFAVKATKEKHVAEFFAITPETILSPYDEAREASGNVVADFVCDAQLTTTAGMAGSLDRLDDCSEIQFASEHPSVWEIPVPVSDGVVDMISGCGFEQCQVTFEAGEITSGSLVCFHWFFTALVFIVGFTWSY